jgi:hypothetical protein
MDTAQKKFGPSSILLGGGKIVEIDNHADFTFGTNNFTISLHVRFSALLTSGEAYLWRQYDDDEHYIELKLSAGPLLLFYAINGAGNVIAFLTNSISLAVDKWYHIAVTCSDAALSLYVDGARIDVGARNDAFSALAANPYIDFSGSDATGWMDDLYISTRAEWTGATFTPPVTHWGFSTRATWNYARAGVGPDGTRGALSAAGAIVVDAAGLIYHDPGPAPVDLTAEARADGKIRLTWHAPAGAATTPDGYIVYMDIGGVWTEQERVSYGGRGYAWTSAALTNAVEYDFIVRAYRTVGGIDYIEPNTTSVSATADDAGPPAITAVAARMM